MACPWPESHPRYWGPGIDLQIEMDPGKYFHIAAQQEIVVELGPSKIGELVCSALGPELVQVRPVLSVRVLVQEQVVEQVHSELVCAPVQFCATELGYDSVRVVETASSEREIALVFRQSLSMVVADLGLLKRESSQHSDHLENVVVPLIVQLGPFQMQLPACVRERK